MCVVRRFRATADDRAPHFNDFGAAMTVQKPFQCALSFFKRFSNFHSKSFDDLLCQCPF